MSNDETNGMAIAQFHSVPEPPLTDAERRSRAGRLCSSFLRNLAFFRAGLKAEVQSHLLAPHHPQFEYWREAHVNFLDICILEWCKLFTERKGQHYWGRVIDDRDRFQEDLYAALNVTADVFSELVKNAKHYRNKFVAHLDEERTMRPPKLELAKHSVVFLYGHLFEDATEARLDLEFARYMEKAQTVYDEALDRRLQH